MSASLNPVSDSESLEVTSSSSGKSRKRHDFTDEGVCSLSIVPWTQRTDLGLVGGFGSGMSGRRSQFAIESPMFMSTLLAIIPQESTYRST